MAWDSDKSTAADPDNPQADEQLSADEWDNHVSEGHFPSDELNFGVDGNGDPVITDPQNGGQTVMRYDRSTGSWVVDALEADKESISQVVGQLRFENNSSNQSIPDDTITKVKFKQAAIEDSDIVSVSTSNSEITVLEAGTYMIQANVQWDDDSAWSNGDLADVRVKTPNRTYFPIRTKSTTETQSVSSGMIVERYNGGETVFVNVLQRSGSSKELNQSSPNSSSAGFFSVVRLG